MSDGKHHRDNYIEDSSSDDPSSSDASSDYGAANEPASRPRATKLATLTERIVIWVCWCGYIILGLFLIASGLLRGVYIMAASDASAALPFPIHQPIVNLGQTLSRAQFSSANKTFYAAMYNASRAVNCPHMHDWEEAWEVDEFGDYANSLFPEGQLSWYERMRDEDFVASVRKHMIPGLDVPEHPAIAPPEGDFDVQAVDTTSPGVEAMHRLTYWCGSVEKAINLVSALPNLEARQDVAGRIAESIGRLVDDLAALPEGHSWAQVARLYIQHLSRVEEYKIPVKYRKYESRKGTVNGHKRRNRAVFTVEDGWKEGFRQVIGAGLEHAVSRIKLARELEVLMKSIPAFREFLHERCCVEGSKEACCRSRLPPTPTLTMDLLPLAQDLRTEAEAVIASLEALDRLRHLLVELILRFGEDDADYLLHDEITRHYIPTPLMPRTVPSAHGPVLAETKEDELHYLYLEKRRVDGNYMQGPRLVMAKPLCAGKLAEILEETPTKLPGLQDVLQPMSGADGRPQNHPIYEDRQLVQCQETPFTDPMSLSSMWHHIYYLAGIPMAQPQFPPPPPTWLDRLIARPPVQPYGSFRPRLPVHLPPLGEQMAALADAQVLLERASSEAREPRDAEELKQWRHARWRWENGRGHLDERNVRWTETAINVDEYPSHWLR